MITNGTLTWSKHRETGVTEGAKFSAGKVIANVLYLPTLAKQ
jgi:hypothetical protein